MGVLYSIEVMNSTRKYTNNVTVLYRGVTIQWVSKKHRLVTANARVLQ